MEMYHADKVYLGLVKDILTYGIGKDDRTGTGTISLFGTQMKFDLSKGFPLLTTKKLPLRIIAEELFWFLSGSTNVKDLIDKNVHIWDADAYRWHKEKNTYSTITKEEFVQAIKDGDWSLGELNNTYGKQWTNWESVEQGEWGIHTNQIEMVIQSIKNNPDSRRHIVTAWNPGELDNVALPPCHVMFQFYVRGEYLDCMLTQRSGDMFLGVPFNIASYALLTYLVADMTGYKPGFLTHNIGDAHIYINHLDQVQEQLQREPRPMPQLIVKAAHNDIQDYTYEDIELVGYDPHGVIKGNVSVGIIKVN